MRDEVQRQHYVHGGEVKYSVSKSPARTSLKLLLRMAFSRPRVEHVFRVAKGEVRFDHFEGRSYVGVMRHMALCQLATDPASRGRTRADGADDGADGEGA
jgi:SRSO17 transposase